MPLQYPIFLLCLALTTAGIIGLIIYCQTRALRHWHGQEAVDNFLALFRRNRKTDILDILASGDTTKTPQNAAHYKDAHSNSMLEILSRADTQPTKPEQHGKG